MTRTEAGRQAPGFAWAAKERNMDKKIVVYQSDDNVRLEKRVDALEGDVVQIRQGMRHLVQQVSVPPAQPPRRKSGFGVDKGGKSPKA